MFDSIVNPWESSNGGNTSQYQKEYTNNYEFLNYHKNKEVYYNLESVPKPKQFSCEICNKSFYSYGQFKKHNDQHVECPFPECNFKAHTKIVDQHIDHQHMLVNFEALQIDDETWISERKKRFPSIQRADIRRTEQIEKLKRGERLGKNNKKYGNNKAKQSNVGNTKNIGVSNTNTHNKIDENSESKVESKFNKKNSRFQRKLKKEKSDINELNIKKDKSIHVITADDDSDSECKLGVPAFKGITAFYESIGEVSLFGVANSLNKSSCEKLSELDISDEDEWNENSSNSITKSSCKLQNALGSLIGAYNSTSESDSEIGNVEQNLVKDSISKEKIEMNVTMKNTDKIVKNEEKQINKIVNDNNNSNLNDKQYDESLHLTAKRKRKHIKFSKSNGDWRKPKVIKAKRRRPTLLQKLLEPDIVHERNVILQCIKYIIENNYFE